jgi:hypothetical protein
LEKMIHLPRSLEAVAYHEAGHALTAYAAGLDVYLVTNVETRAHQGQTRFRDLWGSILAGAVDHQIPREFVDWQAENRIIVDLAGYAAELRYRRVRGGPPSPGSDDPDVRSALEMMQARGWGTTDPSPVLHLLWYRTRHYLGRHWSKVEAIAEAVIHHRAIDAERFYTIMSEVDARPWALPKRLRAVMEQQK